MTAKFIKDKKATYTYDANDHMTVEKDEYGKKNEYQYDVDGNLLKHTKPDGTTMEYTYDKLGNKFQKANEALPMINTTIFPQLR